MDNILDHNLDDPQPNRVMYATFWNRALASLIDFLVLAVLVPISIYNLIDWKSYFILILGSAISILYKPFLEYQYGATLGKMAMGIVVTSYEYRPPNLVEVCFRNVFFLSSGLLSLIIAVYIFQMPEFQNITGYMEYANFAASLQASMLNNIIGVVTIVDVLFLFADDRKRTLHDKIGRTYVVTKNSLHE